MIPGIFLAAGLGSRFGSQKLTTLIGGEPLIVKGLRSCIRSDLIEIIVVLGYEAEKLKKLINEYFPDNKKLRTIVNNDYSKGMISSFNSGLGILDKNTKEVMMILADMPFVSSSTINKLIVSRNGEKMIIPEVNGSYTHPRIIPSCLFPAFFGLDQLNSGKDVLSKNRGRIKTVIFENGEEFMDIDSKNDLSKFRSIDNDNSAKVKFQQ